ncbi:MAG: hypothetical protein HC896_09860 [Bacteroidales bacterium]|nr:hypothetical protein [Bacteroidales bacterium]
MAFATLNDYRPPEKTLLFGNSGSTAVHGSQFDMIIWNIGYAGLHDSMDFFYDGGTQVRPASVAVKNNMDAIKQAIKAFDTINFILLQEVDKASKRSYYIDEHLQISNILPLKQGWLATNYKVPFVPVPVKRPMGKVNSGLASFSDFAALEVTRYSSPGTINGLPACSC